MKIALIGYGKMGKAIEKIALERGHEIVSVIEVDNRDDFHSEAFGTADVAIEFSIPAAAFDNFKACFAANIPVVAGTTGWLERRDEVRSICEREGKTFFYASNYSIGVNLFFAVNRYLARLMNGFPAYDVRLSETHHIHKLDAPSGTALTLADDLIAQLYRKKQWTLHQTGHTDDLVIDAIREGEVPGIHEVTYESETDCLCLKHSAKNRAGFALGAVLAAEFTVGKKGWLGMEDLLQLGNY
ncbi:MAG: 4-hydroxy-tetrahydrodipicolinate reductase [Tannerella sp.]|jgi:4-hydroxy-tetrahydrodipicolinate reductase|nr:4-hydroxy-tetrahydrodipicolinate reductase [Tannerella sp.]